MRSSIIVFAVSILIFACSNRKSNDQAVENIKTEDIRKEHDLIFEDTFTTAVGKEPLGDGSKVFDINSIEYDTLDLPIEPVNSSIRILTTSQFHEDEVWPEAINQTWIGLFKSDSTAYLKAVQPKFERIQDVILDEGEERTGWKVTTDIVDECILLITGLNLTEGPIPSILLNNSQPLPTDTVNLKVEKSKMQLVIDGINQSGYVANYKMRLIPHPNDGQKEQVLVAKRNFDDEYINIIWAGDLDGDGKVDLIIDTSRHYNVRTPTLFLSSQAKEEKFVKCVAMHRTVGC